MVDGRDPALNLNLTDLQLRRMCQDFVEIFSSILLTRAHANGTGTDQSTVRTSNFQKESFQYGDQ
jgi:hypothetical protein